MNRPLLGIYSDEGVGYEHGGPREFSVRAFSKELRQELGYGDDVEPGNNGQDFYSPAAFAAPQKKKRSFVVSDPFASMDVQQSELARKQNEFLESTTTSATNGVTQVTKDNDEPKDEVSARIEYFRKRITEMRQRA